MFFGLLIGLIVYGIYPGTTGLILGIAIAAIGLTIGIIIATRIWKKGGTVDFISGDSASPELDNPDGERIIAPNIFSPRHADQH